MMVQPGGDVLVEYSALYKTLLKYVKLCGDDVERRWCLWDLPRHPGCDISRHQGCNLPRTEAEICLGTQAATCPGTQAATYPGTKAATCSGTEAATCLDTRLGANQNCQLGPTLSGPNLNHLMWVQPGSFDWLYRRIPTQICIRKKKSMCAHKK